MVASLDALAVLRYRQDGFRFPHRVLAPEAAAGVAAQIMAFAAGDIPARYPDPHNQLFLLKAYLLFEWADRLAHDEALLDAVQSLIGPDILLWSSGVFWKAPGTGSHVSWHQDATHFELEPLDGVVRAWLALTPATLENGTMRFLPGGHRLGAVAHVDRMTDGELLSRGETMAMAIDDSRTVPVVIEAGEVSFHHLFAPHASGPNASETARVNYVMTFVSSSIRPQVGPDSAMLVRGVDRFGHFECETRPHAFATAEALRAHERAMALRYAILFRGAAPPPLPVHDPDVWSVGPRVPA